MKVARGKKVSLRERRSVGQAYLKPDLVLRELLAMLDGVDAFAAHTRGAFTMLDGIDTLARI
jgi:hypothetical protein